jgi:predicted DNA-binding ribbon-helix-helix protein
MHRGPCFKSVAFCVIFATLWVFHAPTTPKVNFSLYVASLLQWGVCSMRSPVVKRSIVLAGHKTSVSLEDEFWRGLKEIAGKRLITLSTLVNTIDAERQQGNLSSALRIFVLNHYRGRVCDMEARYGIQELLSHPVRMHS